ncbi:MAG: hypothetical protein ACTSVL_12085, partial [Promethearchaeota archaeon]
RRNLAFREGILEDEILGLITDIVTENKNMRIGIDMMRACGIRADEQGLSSINSEMILESRNIINPTFRADVIDNLRLHEQVALWSVAKALLASGDPYTKVEKTYEIYMMLCEELNIKHHVSMSFRKYIRNLADVKAIHKDYLNPTVEKKGRQLEIKLTDISAEKLCEYFKKNIPHD